MTDVKSTAVPAGVETNGLNVIDESERKGRPSSLFWPWFASNISVLSISYGAFVLGFGLSFWQALAAAIVGTVASFALCGFVSLAGKRGSAPTMTLSRAPFGVHGNRVPSFLSWVLTVGWETVLVVLATLATSTVLTRLGWGGGTISKIIVLILVAGVTVLAGIFGFDLIMRVQTFITIATAVLTVGYMILAASHIQWSAVTAHKSGGAPQFFGALVMVMTALGLGWVNCAADYSRYLPRSASSGGVVGWTTLGGSLGPIVLIVFGLMLSASDQKLADGVGADPIGALTPILPTWFLLPFLLVVLLGLIGGAVMDIYSSGLALMSAGLPVPRPVAALIDGIIMSIGAALVVFVAKDFLGPFQGFLITVGVPIAAWCGIFLGDLLLRKRDYDEPSLFDARGRYGSVQPIPLALIAIGTVVGWGLVTNSLASWLQWQGYLLGPIGGKEGDWAYANLGVLAALLIGFLGTLLTKSVVRREEATA
ncbi:allantoin permease [Calidifontibacter sp. DB0510]|uniref:Allantoin permease n=1 Tax=Metallococcus carri TaxID=1656884 RepID=A0A967E9E2_9MICO|nr:cytosine permease [Metallococcus carri]NHN55095.1 allantoin permease [Metallococcus carri]NOP36172.1 allantoin permease [Calidifontibacter sp. DB2511S]